MSWTRVARIGGVAGPVGFIAAWATASVIADRYSPVGQPISELAASGAATRPLMTAGFIAIAVGVAAFGSVLSPRGRAAAFVNAIATLAVAALPLNAGMDDAHGIAAGIAYLSLVAVAYLGGATPRLWGVAAVCLILSARGFEEFQGLLQRVGLTTVDAWIVWTSLRARSAR